MGKLPVIVASSSAGFVAVSRGTDPAVSWQFVHESKDVVMAEAKDMAERLKTEVVERG